MLYPKPITKVSNYTLLRIWTGSETYDQMVAGLCNLDYQVTTHQIRRRLRQVLTRMELLPPDRPAEPNDYQRAKDQLFAEWKHGDIL